MFTGNWKNYKHPVPTEKFDETWSYLNDLLNETLSLNNLKWQTIPYNKFHYNDADLFELQIPGFSKEQIEIEYDKENYKLNISAKYEGEKSESAVVIRGFEQKSFSCYLGLAKETQYDATRIDSVLSNGILSITMPFVVQKKSENVKIHIS